MTNQRTENVIAGGIGFLIGCIIAVLLMHVEAKYYEKQIADLKAYYNGAHQ